MSPSFEETSDPEVCVIVVNLSENYICEQSMSILTSRLTLKLLIRKCRYTQVICILMAIQRLFVLCPNAQDMILRQSAWADLLPLLRHLKASFPSFIHLHFLSDEPTTQYRNKINFFLASSLLFDEGFTGCTSNFFEAGHSQGPADAVGGFLKRTADAVVNCGADISTVDQLFDALPSKTSVKLFKYEEDDNSKIEKLAHDSLKPLAGTMTIHQLQMLSRFNLSVRNMSCFCEAPNPCNCLDPRKVQFVLSAQMLLGD